MSWQTTLTRHLQQLRFAENELAFLALTSKIEGAVRDRLAYGLHGEVGHQDGRLVCREWKRRDLAVIRSGDAELLVEFKAYYTFDILREDHPWQKEIELDFKKMAKVATRDTEQFAILLLHHLHAVPDESVAHAIKYLPIIRKGNAAKHTLEQAGEKICRVFECCASQPLVAGTAFGTEVTVGYWLLRGGAPAATPAALPDLNESKTDPA